MEKHKPNRVPPEQRLELAIYAAPLFAIAFFWFGWTSYPSISFWAPAMSGVLMGCSVVWIFVSFRCTVVFSNDSHSTSQLALFNYMIDAYLYVAASALAANTVVRSASGAAFPVSRCP